MDSIDLDLAKRWITALESGDYQQTTGTLKDETGYCCLGVVCNLIDPTAWIAHHGQWAWYSPGSNLTDYGVENPPPNAMAPLGLTSEGAQLSGDAWEYHQEDGTLDTLVGANDDERWDFVRIAAALRTYYGLPPREETPAPTTE